MRHKKKFRKFSKTPSHRKAMFRNMSVSLIDHEMIKTTLAKAKDLRMVFEPLVTKAKREDSVANRRYLFAHLRDDSAVKKIYDELAPRYKERNGGYLRIYKYGHRSGDSAPMALVVLVDSAHDLKGNHPDTQNQEVKESS